MPSISTVVFDLDGTLLDHEGAVIASLREWLRGRGLSPDDIERLIPTWFALEEKHYGAYRAGETTLAGQRRRRLREFLPQAGMVVDERALDSTFAGYLERYEANWRAFPDAASALRRVIDMGFQTAVLTNGDQEQQTQKLEAIGLLGLSGPVFASSSIGAAKPSARAYAEVSSRLGVQAEEAVMVGDNYALDVIGARQAAFEAVHLDRAENHEGPEALRISTLERLPEVLSGLTSKDQAVS